MYNQYTSESLETKLKRFWSKVNKNGSIPAHCPELGNCWEWQAHIRKDGYGHCTFNKMCDRTHRIAWIIAYGEIPDNLWVLHKCDNRACVNPNHLFLGTHQDNIKDMHTKGRARKARGMQSVGNRKFTWDQVREIRELYKQGVNQHILANKYDAKYDTIHRLVTLKSYIED